jgi:hypothetical protein
MTRSHDTILVTTRFTPAIVSAIALCAMASPAAADEPARRDGASPPTATQAATQAGQPTQPQPTQPTKLASAAASEPAGGETTTTTTTAATATPGEPAAPGSRYPRAVIARPLTLPAHLAMIGADASANHDLSAMAGAPIVGYGITDDLEIQVPYAFSTKDFEIKGSLNADVGYKLLRGAVDGKLEAIARVRGGYDVRAEAANPLMLGIHTQYNFTDTLAVISGTPGSQQLRISLADDATMKKPIDLSLPIGVGYQATGELYLQLDTRLVQLDLSDSATTVIGADVTPVALTIVYNVLPALDVQGAIATDLSNSPGDALSFLIGARYYAGAL